MRVAIIDDEKVFLDHIENMIDRAMKMYHFQSYSIDNFSSAAEFLENYKPGNYDLLIVDIYIDKENGIDLAKEVRSQDDECIIVFCTTSNEFAKESYRVKASYYLVKPIIFEDMIEMFNQIDIDVLKERRTIVFPDDFSCRVNDIIFTEYYNHKVTIHLCNNQQHAVYMPQKDVENLLIPLGGFSVINRGCIVNLERVKDMDDQSIIMDDNQYVVLAKNRVNKFKKILLDFRVRNM